MRMGTGMSREEERFAAREGPKRKRNIAILAGVLLLGALLPTVVQGRRHVEVEFVTSTIFGQSTAPATLNALVFCSLLAGICCLGILRCDSVRLRGVLLAQLGIIPLLIAFTDNNIGDAFAAITQTAGNNAVIIQLMLTLGAVGLFVGARARWYRPTSATAYGVGLIGSIIYVLSLLIPAYPDEMGRTKLFSPVMMVGLGGNLWFAFTQIVEMLCGIAAAVVCGLNLPTRRGELVRLRAGLAFWLLVGGWLVGLIGAVTTMLFYADRLGGGAIAFLMILKFGTMTVGLLLLLPFGLVDLMIGDTPAPLQPE
jgi:hypothetical protein